MSLVIRFFVLVFPIMMLMGCSYIAIPSGLQPKDRHYLEARSIPPLKIPPGMSSSAFQTSYPVSDRAYPENEKKINLVPPGLMN